MNACTLQKKACQYSQTFKILLNIVCFILYFIILLLIRLKKYFYKCGGAPLHVSSSLAY